jgi:hypothetical protein
MGSAHVDTPLEQLGDLALVEVSLEEKGPGVFRVAHAVMNAHAVVARVMRGLKKKGWPPRALKILRTDMLSRDYEYLLRVARRVQDPRSLELEHLAALLALRTRELEQEEE